MTSPATGALIDVSKVSLLASLSRETLQDLRLRKLNEAAELRKDRKEILEKIDGEIVSCERDAEIIGWLCQCRDELRDSLRIDALQKSFDFVGSAVSEPGPGNAPAPNRVGVHGLVTPREGRLPDLAA